MYHTARVLDSVFAGDAITQTDVLHRPEAHDWRQT